jgi:hypothetical protein
MKLFRQINDVQRHFTLGTPRATTHKEDTILI